MLPVMLDLSLCDLAAMTRLSLRTGSTFSLPGGRAEAGNMQGRVT